MKDKIILGIDPGTAVTGFGVIKVGVSIKPLDFGCIRPPREEPLSTRYRVIFEGLCSIIDKYNPTECSVETQYVSKNVSSAMKLGMARGMAILAATLREIPIFEYSPTRVKSAVTGTGRASKQEVQKMIKHLLHLSTLPTPEDAADALALAICHFHAAKSRRCQRV
ncbi:MAG: Crossover junction endodeoxyribonuclease RuvC [Chlamydiales bacterium]|nr:Crossover junction endodeoxyribonuclease RuvC [Chlamydiales bacterium]MCH9619403.1 Crossover junction endodeoxyribonuclease RuvC [Chlamydiales bacterium]MCH9622207.1 Crossover junction endodeoxyribonuclease RuvC [Chlamydiales bacterium]